MLFDLRISRVLVVGAGLMAGACTSAAPPLPLDTTGTNRVRNLSPSDFSKEDLAQNCQNIAKERAALMQQIATSEGLARSTHQKNQVAGFLGGLFLVPYAWMKDNGDISANMYAYQMRKDVLIRLAAFKDCPN